MFTGLPRTVSVGQAIPADWESVTLCDLISQSSLRPWSCRRPSVYEGSDEFRARKRLARRERENGAGTGNLHRYAAEKMTASDRARVLAHPADRERG